MAQRKHFKNSGFTLIELAVVMVIIGLLMSAVITAYGQYYKHQQVKTTSENIETAQAALQKYQDDNGFYPCPADPTSADLKATNCAAPPPPGIKRVQENGKWVRIGVMPMLDMDGDTKLISGSETVDGWRRRLTYAVTESMAIDSTQFNAGNGAITVQNAAGTEQTSNVNFLVLSHGEDGTGAYNTSGILTRACGSGTVDSENCNDDATFVAISPGESRSFALGTAAYNDDFIDYATATAVETTKSCPDGTILRGIKSNGDLICNPNGLSCPSGQAMIGVAQDGVTAQCAPVTAACSANQVLVQMTMGAAPTCIKNVGGACPSGQVQNGTVNDVNDPNYGEPICLNIVTQCPSGYVQVGTQANAQPICVANFNTACPGGMVQVGNNTDGSANCRAISLTTCPAGQYLYGMSNGTPLCSGDRTIADNTCPPSQVVRGISNGAIICGAPPVQPSNVPRYKIYAQRIEGNVYGGDGGQGQYPDSYNYSIFDTARGCFMTYTSYGAGYGCGTSNQVENGRYDYAGIAGGEIANNNSNYPTNPYMILDAVHGCYANWWYLYQGVHYTPTGRDYANNCTY